MTEKNEKNEKSLEEIVKRNRKITMACGIVGGVLGVGVGACSQAVTTTALQALLRPDEIADRTWRTVTKVGIFGIGSAVGTGVSRSVSEPISAIGELFCTKPDYARYTADLIDEMMEARAKKDESEDEDD